MSIQLPAIWRWWLFGGARQEGNLLGMLLFGRRGSESFLCSIPALKTTSFPWLPVLFLPGCRGGTGVWGDCPRAQGAGLGAPRSSAVTEGTWEGSRIRAGWLAGIRAGGFSKAKHEPLKAKAQRWLRERRILS